VFTLQTRLGKTGKLKYIKNYQKLSVTVVNSVHTTDADEMRQSSLVGVGWCEIDLIVWSGTPHQFFIKHCVFPIKLCTSQIFVNHILPQSLHPASTSASISLHAIILIFSPHLSLLHSHTVTTFPHHFPIPHKTRRAC